jgi:hypothetical protein
MFKDSNSCGFIDFSGYEMENVPMPTPHSPSQHTTLLFSLAVLLGTFLTPGEPAAKDFNPDNPLNPPAPVYWCPGKTPDQQIATKQGSGCQPLHDPRAEESFRESARKQGLDLPDRDPIKIVELQNEASKFSDRYRNFLSCCLTDEDAPAQILDLIDAANHVLKAVQQKGIYNSAGFGIGSRADGSPGTGPGDGTGSGDLGGGPGAAPKLGTFARQYTLSEIVGTVARARNDLLFLKDRLDKLRETQQGVDKAEYEQSGRMRQQLEDEREAIKKEFSAKKPPSSAPTGMDIQDTTLRPKIGGDIEDTKLNANFGADIGASVSPYSNVGESLRPRRGDAIHDSQLPHRPGAELQDTTIHSSTGFEVDNAQNRDGSSTIPRRGVGPSIGDSNLNSNRR